MKELNEVQIILLEALDRNKIPKIEDMIDHLNESDYQDQNKELAFYINQLADLGYVRVAKGAFATGGSQHEIYQNNVVMIWFEKLIIMPIGKLALRDGSAYDID